jgi:hypothetical protein
MCLLTRISAEPDCHVACAEYAARACPFLSRPRARRNDNDRPIGSQADPFMHQRNPGVVALFVHTERWLKRQARDVGPPLFKLPDGEPHRLTFWKEGRRATRPEVMASLDSGRDLLQEQAATDGKAALDALAVYYARTVRLVERWTDDFDDLASPHDNEANDRAKVCPHASN